MSFTSAVTPYLLGSVSVHSIDPSGNAAAFYPGLTGSYLNFGTAYPARFNDAVSNLFVESWCTLYQNTVTMYVTGVLDILAQTGDDWGLRCDGTYDRFMFYHYAAGGTSTAVTATTPLIRGQWYHVSVNFTTNGTIYLFVNGVLQNPGGTSIGGTPRFTPTASLFVGTPSPLPGGWYATSGYIQDVRIIKGGIGPTATYTPQTGPWAYQAIPSYVTGGVNVLGLAAQYMTQGAMVHPVNSGSRMYHS